MYVLTTGQAVKAYPYSMDALRRDNPNTSFPSAINEQTLAEWSVFPVVETPAPPCNAVTENCNQLQPILQNGKWTMAWKITPASSVQIAERIRANADYIAFWDALTTSTVYTAIRTQSFTSLPMNTLATELIALLGDAKAGRPNEPAIQASMAAILTSGTFTAVQLTELQTALVAGHLESIYTLA